MAEEVVLPPVLKKTFDYIRTRPCVWLSAREGAIALKISYVASYRRLRRLARLGLIREYVSWMRRYDRARRRWIVYRRRFFHYLPPPPPPLEATLDWMKERECQWLSTRDVSIGMGITTATAYYRLMALYRRGLIRSYVAWVVRPRLRRRFFHYVKPPVFFKSHSIISLDYAEEHLFEIHIISPHLEKELTDEDEKTLTTLAFELMLDYGIPEKLLTHPDTSINLGLVQTKSVAEFNKKTKATIFDVSTTGAPARTSYEITWEHKKAWVEMTLTGERIEHPAKVVYTDFKSIGIVGREALKEEWKKLVEKEVVA